MRDVRLTSTEYESFSLTRTALSLENSGTDKETKSGNKTVTV